VSSSAEERIALTSLSCWTSDLPLSIISNQDRIQISKTLQKMKEDRFWLKDSNRQFLLEREIKIKKSCKKNQLHKSIFFPSFHLISLFLMSNVVM